MTNFWQKLERPFFVLAPMEEVTDTVFRQIVASVGKPQVMFTEFTNVDSIVYADMAKNTIPIQRLVFTKKEKPIVAQIWGTDPDKFFKAAVIIKKLGFDGVDINFGCPDKKVVKMGAGGGAIPNFSLPIAEVQSRKVTEIIQATKEGAKGIPVSVKTRIGNKSIITEEWINFLLDQNLEVITVHGRSVAELSSVPNHWDEISKAVECRNKAKSQTLIVGNGDVTNLTEAREKVHQYGVDGVMIGRGIFANPALFAEKELSQEEKIQLYKRHINLFLETWGENKNWQELKKFMKVYISGWPGVVELRQRLARSTSKAELKEVLNLCYR